MPTVVFGAAEGSPRNMHRPTPSHPRYIITVHRRGYRFDG